MGPPPAEKLGLAQVSYVGAIEKDGSTLKVRRMLEDGYMTIRVKTPCLLTCIKELNQPRYMNIRSILSAYAKPLTTMTYETLKAHPLIDKSTIGLQGSPTNIYKSFTPPQKGVGKMLTGDSRTAAAQAVDVLAAKHII